VAASRQFEGKNQRDLNLSSLRVDECRRGRDRNSVLHVDCRVKKAGNPALVISGMAKMNLLRNRLRGGVIGMLVAGSATVAATSSFAVPSYDGLWSVSIVTEKGDCDRGYRYPIRISKGVLANAGDTAFSISGKVAPTGAITVTVSAGGKSASGAGRLSGDMGGGNWSGGACSGTWTAERRGS
jgi:hypothetical protein